MFEGKNRFLQTVLLTIMKELLGQSIGRYHILERLGDRELDDRLGRNVHGIAGRRIAADPRLAVLNLELTEAFERDLSAVADFVLDECGETVQKRLHIFLFHVRALGQRVDHFRSGHSWPSHGIPCGFF